jgi:hypothetical protein
MVIGLEETERGRARTGFELSPAIADENLRSGLFQ